MVQPKILTAIVIFLGSYLPVTVVMFLRTLEFGSNDHGFRGVFNAEFWKPKVHDVGAWCTFLALLCFVITVIILKTVKAKQEVVMYSVECAPAEFMSHTFPYIVSFTDTDYTAPSKFLSLCVFLAWLFMITYKSGQIILNPLLIILGWQLHNVTYKFSGSDNTVKGRALARENLQIGTYRLCAFQNINIISSSRF